MSRHREAPCHVALVVASPEYREAGLGCLLVVFRDIITRIRHTAPTICLVPSNGKPSSGLFGRSSGFSKNDSGFGFSSRVASLVELEPFCKTFGKTAPPYFSGMDCSGQMSNMSLAT